MFHPEDLGSCSGMDIKPVAEGFLHVVITAHVRDDAEFDLAVIRTEQPVVLIPGNEGLADLAPFLRANGNVLQVRIVAGQATRRSNGLQIARMNAVCYGISR
jgi:hypothetical protein